MTRSCTTLAPGLPGTKRLLAEHGSRLFCVRYRYDDLLGRKLKTVEIVVASSPWKPPCRRDPAAPLLQVRTAPHERRLHDAIRDAGGTWDARLAVWLVPRAIVRELGLTNRVVQRTKRNAPAATRTREMETERPGRENDS